MVTLKEIASLKLSKKQKRKLLAKGKLRDPFEIWVDHHNHKLEIIKQALALNRLTTPLFDSPRFTKNLEAAYIKMYERYQLDLQPDNMIII